MDEPELKSITVVFDSTLEETARVILKSLFPEKTSWEKHQAESMAGFIQEMIVEMWGPIRQILQREGIDERGRERVRRVIVLACWNQVCTDLFGEHVQVVFEKETGDDQS